MKTKISLLILLILSLLLTACGGASQAATTNTNGTPQPGGVGSGELSPVTKLALGTLMLEETEQAITAEQAAELVTLWQAYQAISNSETAATAELDAVIKQIRGSMTAEQIAAIEAMALTRESMTEIMQSLGLDYGGRGGTNAEGTPEAGFAFGGEGGMTPPDGAQSGGGTNRGGGMGPGGGGMMPPGGGDMGGMAPDMQTTPDASTQATMQARMQAQANRVSPMILQALIAMLESK